MRKALLIVTGLLLVISSIGCTNVQYKRFVAYSSKLDGDRGKDHPRAWENNDRTIVLHRGRGINFKGKLRYGPDGDYRSDDIRRNSSIGEDQD